MREINSGIVQSIRNRNLITEQIAGSKQQLPIKYDLLNAKPLKDWDFMTRAYNAVSPVPLNLEQSEGRKFLWNSGHDLRQSVFYAPDGTNLTKDAKIRSLFAKAIGEENVELDLNKLARDPRIIASLQERDNDIKSGKRGEYDNKDYYHNRVIGRLMAQVRRKAWNKISGTRIVQEVIQEQLLGKQAQRQKQIDTGKLLTMYK